MSLTTAVLLAIGLVVSTVVLGLVLRRRDGRIRAVAPCPTAAGVTAVDLGLEQTAAFGSGATLVQFSTEFCGGCPQTRRLLGEIADERPDVSHVDVDLTHRPDIARHFAVLQTPTTLVLDGAGNIRGRISGAPARAAVVRHIDEILGSRV